MSTVPTINIDYFSDVLCVWAYAAQIRVDELQLEFGERVRVRARYFPVFGHTRKKIETQWEAKGGLQGYATHVHATARPFEHVQVHPEVWITNTPTSSLPAHLWLAALRCLEEDGQCAAGSVEKAAWAMREAFFRDARDISRFDTLRAILSTCSFEIGAVQARIENGEAFAVQSQDHKMSTDMNIRSSPTMIFNEDRQRLTGNVGYKIIQANVRELLDSPGKRHSWC